MKQATVEVFTSKDQSVHKNGVTPIEAMLLTAEHHRNTGGVVVLVDKASIKETGHEIMVEVEKDVDTIVVENGKKIVKTEKGKVKEPKWANDNRTVDQELDRLRTKYHASKIKALLTEVSDLKSISDDFDAAIKKATSIIMPTGKLSETKVA